MTYLLNQPAAKMREELDRVLRRRLTTLEDLPTGRYGVAPDLIDIYYSLNFEQIITLRPLDGMSVTINPRSLS